MGKTLKFITMCIAAVAVIQTGCSISLQKQPSRRADCRRIGLSVCWNLLARILKTDKQIFQGQAAGQGTDFQRRWSAGVPGAGYSSAEYLRTAVHNSLDAASGRGRFGDRSTAKGEKRVIQG